MLNGLDLFSGIGGIGLALLPWVRPIAYCENDRHAQANILSRMATGELPLGPIWDDIRTLDTGILEGNVDIVTGGFPCQDISCAGSGKGLAGERSGLFFQIVRLAKEIKPKYLFLENVPAITGRGLETVVREITEIGYDCRWTTLSAAEVGANHRRERWWLLGYSKHDGSSSIKEPRGFKETIFNDSQGKDQTGEFEGADTSAMLARKSVTNSDSKRELQQEGGKQQFGGRISNFCEDVSDTGREQSRSEKKSEWASIHASGCGWWSVEPDVGRVVDGIPFRVDRIRGLGNAVVPLCAREAFKRLMGLK